jgi:serine/threonine-protein kinase RsbW
MSLCEQTIQSNVSSAKSFENEVINEMISKGYGEEAVFALRLSLEEALTNAIQHGSRGKTYQSIHVGYRVTPELIEINIADEGDGFTPGNVPDPTTEEKLSIPSGRGILLMRAYMDVVEYNDQGNAVRLVKYNSQQPQKRWRAENTGQLEIEVSDFERHTVLSLSGSADMAETQALDRLLNRVLEQGSIEVYLDLNHLDFICSLGLGVLIKAQKRCRQQDGDLVLIEPQPPVMRVLKTTRLTELFKIFGSLQIALKSQKEV